MKAKHIQHLYRRIGFGILPSELNKLSKKSKKEVVNNLFKSSKNITPLEVDTSEIKNIFSGSMMMNSKLDPETRRQIILYVKIIVSLTFSNLTTHSENMLWVILKTL